MVEAGHGHLQHVDGFTSIFSRKILHRTHIRNRLFYSNFVKYSIFPEIFRSGSSNDLLDLISRQISTIF